jgi:hypothetical protein
MASTSASMSLPLTQDTSLRAFALTASMVLSEAAHAVGNWCFQL